MPHCAKNPAPANVLGDKRGDPCAINCELCHVTGPHGQGMAAVRPALFPSALPARADFGEKGAGRFLARRPDLERTVTGAASGVRHPSSEIDQQDK
jgi:hypothetical protein